MKEDTAVVLTTRRWTATAATIAMTAAFTVTTQALPAPAAGARTTAPAAPAPVTAPGERRKLDKRDRQLLAAARRAGRPTVTLLVAADRGRSAAAAAQLRRLGGVVTGSNARLDYLKVRVPTANVEKSAEVSSIDAVDVDGLIRLDDPKPDGATTPEPQPAPGAATPRVNPYLPNGDTYAAQFGQQFGKWDGKGVTIAVMDSGIDLDNPALTTTSDGRRKIVDWYDANDPVNSGDGTWVKQTTQTYTGSFDYAGRTWTAPATGGPYTVGVLSETAGDLGAADSETGGDLNRDGDRTDSFGVLLDTVTKQVRVDVNQNGDFTDDTPMTDYAKNFDVGHFGTDNPATAVAERMPFVVQTDKAGYVNIGIAGAEHGSHVAGIAAGHSLFGGRMDGAAPGANLMAIKVCLTGSACTSSGLLDGLVYAATHGADVVNISIGGLPALNDGNNARAELYNRTIATYNMQVFISAGNSGAGANSVGDPSVATDAISVGSYITSATWLSNYGSRTAAREGLHPFSSRGPREDGGFKPDIVAPGAAISTIPLWEQPGPVAGTYALPPGYAMLQGTSMASPQAAGAAALLVSAYKATHSGRRPSVVALRSAIRTGARFVPGVGAYAQGAGLFNVVASAAVLAFEPKPDTVTTSVEVHTTLSNLLATPNTGVGIHDREGVTLGRRYTRTYTLTRTTGAAGAVAYRVGWVGNDGTFRSADRVTLPLNTAVSFPVTVDPGTVGVHSALLRLDNQRTAGIDLQTMNTVFVPGDLTAGNGYSVTASGTVNRNQVVSRFVRVPAGASALTVTMDAGGAEAGKGQVRFVRYDPTGVPIDSTSSLSCYNPDAGGGCAGGTALTRTVTNPAAGVWELVVEARRTSDTDPAPWSLTASVLGATVSPNPDVIATAAVGVPVSRSYTVTNSQGAFTGRLTGGPLGSASNSRPSIGEGTQQQFRIEVTPGSTSLTARIGNTSDVGVDLDLVLYNCTSGSCVMAGQSADGDSEEAVTIANPAAGLWVALVDGYAVPAGTTAYDYSDVFVSPAFGAVTVADTDAPRPSGSSWTVPGTVTVGAAPAAGRTLQGQLTVRTSDGVAVGSGVVRVEAVTG